MFRVLQPLYVGRINRADLSQREQKLALGYTRILMWFDDRRWKTDRFDGLPTSSPTERKWIADPQDLSVEAAG